MRRVTADQPRRRRSRRGEGDQLRSEVLEAVNRLLDEWGSHERLTIRAVAREVGVVPGSIYLHFADKSELVWAALAGKYGQLAQRMGEAGEAAGEQGPRERLRAQARAYCQFAVDNPGQYRLMYETGQPPVEWARAPAHPARLVSGRFRAALDACADAGHALRLPPRQSAHTLWTGLHGLITIQHAVGLPAEMPLLGELADGLVDALVAPSAVPGTKPPADTEAERLLSRWIIDADQSGP